MRLKRLFAAMLVALSLSVAFAPGAVAVPRYGSRFTGAHGYIVWVRGDNRYSRVRCTWYAGHSWHLNWWMAPHEYSWTTSDAGNWGDVRPSSLYCTFTR